MHGHAQRLSVVSCANTAEPIDLPFVLWTQVDRRKHKFNRVRQVAPMFPHVRAHWRHLANTIELSVCGGDTVLSQIIYLFIYLFITLTTCFLCVKLFCRLNRMATFELILCAISCPRSEGWRQYRIDPSRLGAYRAARSLLCFPSPHPCHILR